MKSRAGHLAALDGLRALAVVAVLLFHGFPKALPGGFIGVDVFFVVSGFIITRTWFDDLVARRRTLPAFFAKRVRRLAPIYLVVLLCTTVAALVVLRPLHLVNFAESLAAQPVYLQNVVFWNQGDYFDAALSKPLLHTWSLAVEEQFYLSYALLIVLSRRAPRLALPATLAALALSFALGWKVAGASAKTSFYWLPTRVWELAIGVALARIAARPGRALGVLAQVAGVLMILAAILLFDEHARFPGAQSLLACAGTAAVILAQGSDGAWPLPLLDNAVAGYVGRLSYSLYLSHWPIISLWATRLERPLHAGEAAVALALSFAVAHVGYVWIEVPVRTGARLASNRALFAGVGGLGVLLVAAAAHLLSTSGAAWRYPPELARLYVAQQQRSPYRCGAWSRLRHLGAEVCPVNDVAGGANVLILGDSHADQLDEVIADEAKQVGLGAFLTARNCALHDYGVTAQCGEAVLARVVSDIAAHRIRYVLAISYMKAPFSPRSAPARALAATVDRLQPLVDGIYVMQTAPHDAFFDPGARAAALARGAPPPPAYTRTRYADDNRDALAQLRALAAAHPAVTVLDPVPYLCPGEACDFDEGGAPDYFDDNHLSPTGASRLRPLIADALRQIAADAAGAPR